MVKQRDIFSGKIDLLIDPTDSKQAVNKALQELGMNAGRIINTRGTAPAPRVEKSLRQVTLF